MHRHSLLTLSTLISLALSGCFAPPPLNTDASSTSMGPEATSSSDGDDETDSTSTSDCAPECGDNETCVDSLCECNDGFVDSVEGCVAPPCEAEPCYQEVSCTNVYEPKVGFECGPCPAGYSGDGQTCTDADNCTSAEGSPCFDGVECIDLPAPEGVDCGDCPPGFEGSGFTCKEINACDNFPCFTGVECVDVPAPGTGFNCGPCPIGFEGNGVACTDVDGCASEPCFRDVTCTDIPAPGTGATCGPCPNGYEGNGFTCSDIDGCASSPCPSGVECQDIPAPGVGFVCVPRCGDGVIQAGEDCDDGNNANGDGCGATCDNEDCYVIQLTSGTCPSGTHIYCVPIGTSFLGRARAACEVCSDETCANSDNGCNDDYFYGYTSTGYKFVHANCNGAVSGQVVQGVDNLNRGTWNNPL